MRHARVQTDDNNEDSFLDVVANVVGVLIILVMLVGAQATRTAAEAEVAPPPEPPPKEEIIQSPKIDVTALKDELKEANQSALNAEKTLLELNSRIVKVNLEQRAYDQQRVELAQHQALISEDLELRKQLLSDQKQQEYEVQRKLLETKIDLEKLTQEQISLLSAPEEVTEVECVPTPLAKIVEGESIHLRLSKGLVSVVPLEELLAEIQYNTEGWRARLQDRNRIVETYGPLNGYRLKLTVAKESTPSPVGGPLVGQLVNSTSYRPLAEFIPISEDLGQNVEQSLLPDGTLTRLLQSQGRQKPTIVVWLYTDSFDEFRILKRAMWERGYPLATRPMKIGRHIGASPQGTRSAAQ